MYSTTNNYEKKMRADKAKAKLNEMNSAGKPKTRTNLLGRKVEVEYGAGGSGSITKRITKKDGSTTIKRKLVVKNATGPGTAGYLKKDVGKIAAPGKTGGGIVFEKSKSKSIGGLNRLIGKRRKTKYDAKTGVDTYKTKKTAFSKPEIKKY